MSAGARFRAALQAEQPLQIAGTINAYTAMLAGRAGFKAIYLSGAGVANASFGMPDLAMTTLNDVCEDIRRITSATELPLLADADTGWGSAFMINRTIREMTWAGAAGCHLEDQVAEKRCGHRPGKALVASDEMCDRLKAAVDGRIDDQFVIMARTDAHSVEGQQAAIDRAVAYAEAGENCIQYFFVDVLGFDSRKALVSGPKHHRGNFITAGFEFGNRFGDTVNRIGNSLLMASRQGYCRACIRQQAFGSIACC